MRPSDRTGTEPPWDRFRALAPVLYAWLRIRIPQALDCVDADDVFQEIACRTLGAWNPTDAPADFRAWVFGIARNVVREELRRAARGGGARARSTIWSRLAAEATSISLRAARREDLARFAALVASLAEDERRLLTYRALEDLTFAQIGRALGIGEDAAKKRWQRLQARLRGASLPG